MRLIETYYGPRLVGAALFGSRAAGRPRADSDWDLLLVLDAGEPIRRTLYREWDEQIAPRFGPIGAGVSPHFVHLPPTAEYLSSLWLEIATNHIVLHDPSGRLSHYLGEIRALVHSGRFERRSIHGLPYWRSVA
jgi:hypothetical protein